MTRNELDQVAVLIERECDALLRAWRKKVRELPSAAKLELPALNDHMPAMLVELAAALRADSQETIVDSLIDGSPVAHGKQRVEDGFDIVEIVCEYNVLRGCIYGLATAHRMTLHGEGLHIINQVVDTAVGIAVKTFADYQAADVQRRRDEHLSFIVHDIRTPLNAIALAGRVLEKLLPATTITGHSERVLASMRRNSQQLQALVERILSEHAEIDATEGVKLERRHFDLWPFVELLIADVRPSPTRVGAQLVNAVPEDLVVFADASVLRRIFQNLITNALKHTADGTITVGARLADGEDEVQCWIEDTGTGIAPEFLDKVFDKGTTGDDDSDGTGLGLAIVKTYVSAHGGTVSVESTDGQGSTFRFTLPNQTA